jgi:8-oxo-dGTP pyrophosphatase MutT (NUDIX family)
LINHKQLNKWLAIGGHIELNEDPDEALFREGKEECGLEIKVFNILYRPALSYFKM